MHDMAPQCRGTKATTTTKENEKKENHTDVLLFEKHGIDEKERMPIRSKCTKHENQTEAKRNEFACILRCICMLLDAVIITS